MATTLALQAREAPAANIASTTLDSLANGAESNLVGYDNTGNHAFAIVTVELGSITPAAGGNIRLHQYFDGGSTGTTAPDKNGQGSAPPQPQNLLAGASAKRNTFLVALVPGEQSFSVLNNSGVPFNAGDNAIYVQPFNGEAR